jgi:hypothetical protein
VSHPVKHLADNPRFVDHDAVFGPPIAFRLCNIMISIWSAAQDSHGPTPRGVLPTTTAAFANLGSLVLSDHALDLKKQLSLRGTVGVVIQEDHFDARSLKLIDQHHLDGEIPRQAVRGMNIKAVEGPCGGHIAELLQCGPDQGSAAVAIVNKFEFRRRCQTIGLSTTLEVVALTGDGAFACLSIGGDTRVRSRNDLSIVHAIDLLRRHEAKPAWAGFGSWTVRQRMTGRAYWKAEIKLLRWCRDDSN